MHTETRLATIGLHCAAASQVRNPLALAHFANHPAAGQVANVMVAPLQLSPQHMADAGVLLSVSTRLPDNVQHRALPNEQLT